MAAKGQEAIQRPAAPYLMPQEVIAYARIADMNSLRDAAQNSQFWQMFQDPEVEPLVGDLYKLAAESFQQIAEEFGGVTLDELLSIPQGEIAVGVIPLMPPEMDRDDPKYKGDSPEAIRARIEFRRQSASAVGVLLIVETGTNSALLTPILQRLGDELTKDGFAPTSEEVQGAELKMYRAPSVERPSVEYCQHEGVALLGIGEGLVRDALQRWLGETNEETFAQNDDFGAVMGPCIGAEETMPQLSFYADPVAATDRVFLNASGTQAFVKNILLDLGLKKLKGIGGSSFTGGDLFDDILHVHLLVQPPRDGLFAVLRPENGEVTPPNWVPADVASYNGMQWDVPNTYAGVGRIMDRFLGEDSLQKRAEQPLMNALEVDLQADVIDAVSGRFVFSRWYEPPARLNSQAQAIGIHVKDRAKAESLLKKLSERFPRFMSRQDIGTTVVYGTSARVDDEAGNAPPATIRRPEPQVALLGDYLIYCDSRKFLERIVRAHGGALPRLKADPEFSLVATEIKGKLSGEEPFLLSFVRSDQMIRQFYELAGAPQTRELLRRGGEGNPTLKGLAEIMEKHDLPPFDVISKYFAPSGAFAYDAPAGLHYTSFTIRE